MESQGHPNRCATTVFGQKKVGDGLNVMGLLSCASWRNPEIFTGRKAGYPGNRIYLGMGSSLCYSVHALFNVSKYGQEGYPADQDEADLAVYKEIGDICVQQGLCNGCDRYVEGTPVFISRKD